MIIHALALCAALMAPAPTTAFCSCRVPAGETDAIRRSDAVFTGRLVRSRDTVDASGSYRRVFTFTSATWRKGAARRTVEVETVIGACGAHFAMNRRATIYAHADGNGRLLTGYCDYPAVNAR